ncbi:ABC transporter substrate-binding protein [Nocardioides sp.]|jgi:peptide/nickel transport system substrate-binding protein|uniref:ABC transporter substrate-binding protein n=1 Tax=Nocardioides sp. TaxID=35761 RepID=UPI002BB78F6D|nr:ABC transporter substrate-binding protein [Nocardioides sp.]HVX55631.1 ABC transporter substrate-binding protein [Nocardioides sp.]
MNDNLSPALTRRSMLGGTLALGGFLLVGCGTDNSSSPGGGNGSPVKTLRVGVTGDLLLSSIQRFQANNQMLRRTVYDYLLDKSDDGSYTPSLATAWKWSSDQKSLVITLRDDVKYHTGRAFGPDDVIASANAALVATSGAQAAGLLKLASGLKKTGDNEVTATFDKPFPGYLDAFAMLPIIDSQTYADAPSGKQVIGTGPYTFGSWTAGSKYTLKRNPSYWQSGKPAFDTIEVTVITDSQAMLSALQSGQLDMVDGMVLRDAATLKKSGKFTVQTSATYDIYVGVNTKVKPLDDVRVRQAIAYALDRDRISSQVYSGLAAASCVPWPSNAPGVTQEQVKHYSYDLAKAKSLLQQAGAVGTEIELAPIPSDPSVVAASQIVQYGLTQAGFKVKMGTYDSAAFATHVQAGDFPGLWITNVALTTMGATTALLTANPLTSAKNTENFVTPEYASLVSAVVDATTDKLPAATAALTDYMLEQAFHNTLVQGQTPVVAVPGLSGVTVDRTLAVNLTNATLKE